MDTSHTPTVEGSYARGIYAVDVLRSLGAGPHALHELKEVTQLPSSTLCKIMASAIALGVVRKHGRGYYEPCGPAPLGHVFVPADEAAQRLGI